MSSANMSPASGNQSSQQQVTGTPGSWTIYDPPTGQRPSGSIPYSRTTYQPTSEQLARDALRRRYLRRNVYAPLVIATLLVLALFVAVVVLAFGVSSPRAAEFIRGMSALLIILFSVPIIIMMSILPIAWLALALNRRQKRKEFPETGPMAYRGRIQTLLWQLDGKLNGVQRGVEGASARARRPLISLHSRAAYFGGLWDGIRERFTRSD